MRVPERYNRDAVNLFCKNRPESFKQAAFRELNEIPGKALYEWKLYPPSNITERLARKRDIFLFFKGWRPYGKEENRLRKTWAEASYARWMKNRGSPTLSRKEQRRRTEVTSLVEYKCRLAEESLPKFVIED